MIRVALALVGTVLGLVLVLGYRWPSPPTVEAAAASDPGDVAEAEPCDPDGDEETRVTGPEEAWVYGTVQVRVTLAGCELVDVEKVTLEATNPVSQQRSSGAEQVLRSEALAAQCADIDAVSGATATSAAYTRSLQAALDAAGAGDCP